MDSFIDNYIIDQELDSDKLKDFLSDLKTYAKLYHDMVEFGLDMTKNCRYLLFYIGDTTPYGDFYTLEETVKYIVSGCIDHYNDCLSEATEKDDYGTNNIKAFIKEWFDEVVIKTK